MLSVNVCCLSPVTVATFMLRSTCTTADVWLIVKAHLAQKLLDEESFETYKLWTFFRGVFLLSHVRCSGVLCIVESYQLAPLDHGEEVLLNDVYQEDVLFLFSPHTLTEAALTQRKCACVCVCVIEENRLLRNEGYSANRGSDLGDHHPLEAKAEHRCRS